MHLLLICTLGLMGVLSLVVAGISILTWILTPPMTLDELFELIPSGDIDVLPRIYDGRIYHILAAGLDERSHCSLTDSTQMIFIKGELHQGGLKAYFNNGRLVSWQINYEDKPLSETSFHERSTLELMFANISIAITNFHTLMPVERRKPLGQGAR